MLIAGNWKIHSRLAGTKIRVAASELLTNKHLLAVAAIPVL